MDNTQCGITVLYSIHLDSYCKYVIYLVQGFILVNHLTVYREEMLNTSINFSFNARIAYMHSHLFNYAFNKCFPARSVNINLLHQIIIYIRHKVFHGKVIQFHLNLGNTKPVSYWGIYLHSFS